MMNRIILILLGGLLLASCSESVVNDKKRESKKQSSDTITNESGVGVTNESYSIDSSSAEFYIQRARINMSTEHIGTAMKDINTALSIDRKNIDAHLVLADIYYFLGDEDNILLTLNKACEYAPLDPRPVVKLSELSFLQGNAQLANAYIDKALELDRFNPRAYYMRGMIALSANDTVAALKNFMTSRVQKDDFVEPKIQIAHIYAAQGDTLAKSFFEEAISVSPEDYAMYYDYAMYLQDNGYPELALQCYDKLLSVMPDNANFIYNKGYVYLVYLGDNNNALEQFDKVLQLNPSSINALFNKGRTYEQMGDYINAESIYRQILKKDPDYQLAIDAINRISE